MMRHDDDIDIDAEWTQASASRRDDTPPSNDQIVTTAYVDILRDILGKGDPRWQPDWDPYDAGLVDCAAFLALCDRCPWIDRGRMLYHLACIAIDHGMARGRGPDWPKMLVRHMDKLGDQLIIQHRDQELFVASVARCREVAAAVEAAKTKNEEGQ